MRPRLTKATMPPFSTLVRSANWWLSVVGVSVGLSVLSAYIVRAIDHAGRRVWSGARTLPSKARHRQAEFMARERTWRRQHAASSVLREYERASIESQRGTGDACVRWGLFFMLLDAVGYLRLSPPIGMDTWLLPAIGTLGGLAFLVGRGIRHGADYRLEMLEVACADAVRASGLPADLPARFVSIEARHGGPLSLDGEPVDGAGDRG